jgi:hypothetical protein
MRKPSSIKILASVLLVGILAWALDEKPWKGHLKVSGHALGWVFVFINFNYLFKKLAL